MGGFGIRAAFDIGRKALRGQLAGLNVTGNNIANVNTKGYSRQEVNLVSDTALSTSEGVFGTGVKIEGVRRIRNNLVDRQLRQELQEKGKNETLERIMNQIETTINEPSDFGLRSLLSSFFDNFYELANDPENETTRFNLKESSKVLVNAFHRIDEQLRILSDDIDFEMRRVVEEINSLTKRISQLNAQILSLEGGSKGTANELRDDRDRTLDELSEILDIFSLEQPNGTIDVAAPSHTLITSNFPTQLEINTRNDNGNLVSDIIISGSTEDFKVTNGKLFALLDVRNEIIPHYRERFDTLAGELITRINNIHVLGVGLQGTANEIPKDNNFFTGDSAISIEIARAILDDVNAISAASRVDTLLDNGQIRTTGAPGDNKIALEIASLKQALVLNQGTESLIDFFNSIVSEVGIATKEAHDNVLNEDLLIRQFENIRDSTSAVSLDEEFINLIKFQRGFQASARVITTVDEMFETLINL